MQEIPISVDHKYEPVFDKIHLFREDLAKTWTDSVTEARDEFQRIADKKATERIYGQRGAVTKFAELKVTKDNYKQVKSVFVLLQEYEKLTFNPDDDARIFKKGAELGFSANESLALFNMVHYRKAFENLQEQRQEIFKYLMSSV